MSKKNNPKAEKAKRNLEYAKLHKKKKKMPGRPGGGSRYGAPRPAFAAPGDAPAGAPEEGGEAAA